MRAHPAGPRHGDVVPAGALTLAPPSVEQAAELDSRVWPTNANRGIDGQLMIAGCDVRDLVDEFGSPLQVYDEADVRDRARAFMDAYSVMDRETTVYYAAKAFLTTHVARWVTSEGLGLDVASGGELAVALAAGVPGSSILMHGNNKSIEEIESAIDAGVATIVVDSFEEIARVAHVAAERDTVQPVLVRVTVGVEAHTHEFIATAHEDQKFGFSLATGAAEEAVRRIIKLPSLEFIGLHSHIGSQIFDAAGFEVAAARVVGLAHRLHTELSVSIDELNLGGGMGIAYVSTDDPIDTVVMAEQIRDTVGKSCADAGLPTPRLSFEPGRAIVGPGGITIYTVGTIKPVTVDHGLVRTYVSVDGGMSDNIRTALYDADYTIALASRVSSAEPMLTRIVGKHCESGDIVVRDAWLPSDLAPGDLLAVAATGAYCRSMSSNYNALVKPAVVSVADGTASLMLRRETVEDLLRLDTGVSDRT